MLQPKKTKFRKAQKGRMKGNSQRGHQLAFGSYGIKALEECWLTSRQIEASRIAVTRAMKREGQVWIRVFPDTPVSKKPAEVRMGKGKGSVDHYAAKIRAGCVLYEIGGVERSLAIEALQLAAAKLPIKTRLLIKDQDPWIH